MWTNSLKSEQFDGLPPPESHGCIEHVDESDQEEEFEDIETEIAIMASQVRRSICNSVQEAGVFSL